MAAPRPAQIDPDLIRLHAEDGLDPGSPDESVPSPLSLANRDNHNNGPPDEDETPAKRMAITSLFNQTPVPALNTQRRSNSPRGAGGAMSNFAGFVVRAEATRDHKNSPRMRYTIVVTAIAGKGASDIILTAMPDCSYCIPTKLHSGPDDQKHRKLHLQCHPDGSGLVVRLLNRALVSFYVTAQDKTSNGLEDIVVGSMVEVGGVCVNAVDRTTDDGNVNTQYYINALRITPLSSEAPTRSSIGRVLIERCQRADTQKQSATVLGIAGNGFPGQPTPALREQSEANLAMWKDAAENAASRLEEIAAEQDESNADRLHDDAARLRRIPALDLASGKAHLFKPDSYDMALAPVVQHGLTPADRTPSVVHALINEGADAVPPHFAGCGTINTTIRGAQLTIEMRAGICYDAVAAANALAEGEDANPLLTTKFATIAFTQSMKNIAAELGVADKQLVDTYVTEILPIADFATFLRVTPPIGDINGDMPPTVTPSFPEGGLFIDMAATLGKYLTVSREWIDKMLCDDTGIYDASNVRLGQIYEAPDARIEPATFANAGHQELTRKPFALAWLKSPEGMRTDFRIVYAGSLADLASNPALATDTDAGELHMNECAQLHPAHNGNVSQWLRSEALVFAVAMPDKSA
jgi:hypothetical protein